MFEQEYQNVYGLSLGDMEIEIVAWRVSAFSLSESRFVDREVDVRLFAQRAKEYLSR